MTLPPKDHNQPPPYDESARAEFDAKVEEFNAAAKKWLEIDQLKSDVQAQKLTDFITGGRELRKLIEAKRQAERAPWMQQAKIVQDAYMALLNRLDKIIDLPRSLQTDYMKRKQRDAEEKAKAEREKAEAERKAAEERARRAASALDAAGMADAEAELEKVKKALDRAAKERRAQVGSATGGGRTMSLRKVRSAKIENINRLFMHFREHPDVSDVLTRLANAELRSGAESIPGVTIEITEKAV